MKNIKTLFSDRVCSEGEGQLVQWFPNQWFPNVSKNAYDDFLTKLTVLGVVKDKLCR